MRGRSVGCLVLLAGLGLVGCGGDDSKNPGGESGSGGQAGAGGSAGATGGTSGAAGGAGASGTGGTSGAAGMAGTAGSSGTAGGGGMAGSGGAAGAAGSAGGPSGDPVAVLHASEMGGANHLYTYFDDGSFVLLNDDQNFSAVWVSPLDNFVAFRTRSMSPRRLMVIPTRGGTARELFSGPAVQLTTDPVRFSADESRIAFVTRPAGSSSIFTAPLSAGMPVEVVSGLTFLRDYQLSPDGSRLLYIDNGALHLAMADGTGTPMVIAAAGDEPRWLPDGSRFVYSSSSMPGEKRLFSVAFDGTDSVEIASQVTDRWEIAPDGSRVAYYSGPFVQSDELFTVLLDGTGTVKINATLPSGRDVMTPAESLWAPDSSRVAYAANEAADDQVELFTAMPDGSGRVNVTGTLVSNGSVSTTIIGAGVFMGQFRWAPSSDRIAFIADAETNGVEELFVANADGTGSRMKVSGAMTMGGDVVHSLARRQPFVWSDNGKCLLYVADQLTDGVDELFLTSVDQDSDCPALAALPQLMTNKKVVVPVPTGGSVGKFASSGGRVFATGKDSTDIARELFEAGQSGFGTVKPTGFGTNFFSEFVEIFLPGGPRNNALIEG